MKMSFSFCLFSIRVDDTVYLCCPSLQFINKYSLLLLLLLFDVEKSTKYKNRTNKHRLKRKRTERNEVEENDDLDEEEEEEKSENPISTLSQQYVVQWRAPRQKHTRTEERKRKIIVTVFFVR